MVRVLICRTQSARHRVVPVQPGMAGGKKGVGKRMTATVKAYLEGYFLAGNINKTDRMSAKDMVIQLQNLAKEGEIQFDDIPEIKTVESWIARYSSNLKREYATQRVVENNNNKGVHQHLN